MLTLGDHVLTLEEALCAYATMINTGDASVLEPLLADDFHYASQWVLQEIESKADYLVYIRSKLATIKASDHGVWAELGRLRYEVPGPCVVVAQGGMDDLVALALATIDSGRIQRIDLCCAPSPWAAERSGVYPGREP